MTPIRQPVIAQLNYVREQLERRLMENHDYLALIALDDAIAQFRARSSADAQTCFQRWMAGPAATPFAVAHDNEAGRAPATNLQGR